MVYTGTTSTGRSLRALVTQTQKQVIVLSPSRFSRSNLTYWTRNVSKNYNGLRWQKFTDLSRPFKRSCQALSSGRFTSHFVSTVISEFPVVFSLELRTEFRKPDSIGHAVICRVKLSTPACGHWSHKLMILLQIWRDQIISLNIASEQNKK